MSLTIVRHGETDANRKHVLQGQTNFPLNELGRDQATKAGIRLQDDRFDWVYSSDQSRAFQTAEIIVGENNFVKLKFTENPSQIIRKDTNLRERHFGVLEGSNVSSLMDEAKKRNLTYREYTPEGGETIEEVQSRVEAFYNALFDRARQDPSDLDEARVLVVTHGGLIRETLSIFAGRLGCTFPEHLGQSLHQKLTPNTGIARFSLIVDESGISDFVCRSLHDAEHLGQNCDRVTPPKMYGDDNGDEEKK